MSKIRDLSDLFYNTEVWRKLSKEQLEFRGLHAGKYVFYNKIDNIGVYGAPVSPKYDSIAIDKRTVEYVADLQKSGIVKRFYVAIVDPDNKRTISQQTALNLLEILKGVRTLRQDTDHAYWLVDRDFKPSSYYKRNW